jgi:hypothetical protein
MDRNKRAILRTLCYSDIFEYPLTKNELWNYLLVDSDRIYKKEEIFETVSKLKNICIKKNYIVFYKREEIIEKRERREKISKNKIKSAKVIARMLGVIPTVLLIGVTGSLAIKNAEENDDIDFFIITKKNCVWITRLCILFLLQLIRKRRGRNAKVTKNTICVNFLLDQEHLSLAKEDQNIYSAHEVIQMRPLFMKENIYASFLKANSWVNTYLPHAFLKLFPHKQKDSIITKSNMLSLLENPARVIQLWYMGKYRKTTMITKSVIAFYPTERKNEILSLFKKKLTVYEV